MPFVLRILPSRHSKRPTYDAPAIKPRMDGTVLIFGVLFATFLLAGLVKGVIGLGLPTIAMGLLAIVLPPAQAAALLVVPSFVTNVWQLAFGPSSGRCCGGFGRCCSEFAPAPGRAQVL